MAEIVRCQACGSRWTDVPPGICPRCGGVCVPPTPQLAAEEVALLRRQLTRLRSLVVQAQILSSPHITASIVDGILKEVGE